MFHREGTLWWNIQLTRLCYEEQEAFPMCLRPCEYKLYPAEHIVFSLLGMSSTHRTSENPGFNAQATIKPRLTHNWKLTLLQTEKQSKFEESKESQIMDDKQKACNKTFLIVLFVQTANWRNSGNPLIPSIWRGINVSLGAYYWPLVNSLHWNGSQYEFLKYTLV